MLNRSNSVFRESLDAALLARYQAGDIHLSGPLPGCETGTAPTDDVLRLEQAVLGQHNELVSFLVAAKVESARRSLRLLPENLQAEEIAARGLAIFIHLRPRLFRHQSYARISQLFFALD